MPYKLRVLRSYQVLDGCCEQCDLMKFRLPLRGACSQLLTPTLINAMNKFSVRWFLRICINMAPLPLTEDEDNQEDTI